MNSNEPEPRAIKAVINGGYDNMGTTEERNLNGNGPLKPSGIPNGNSRTIAELQTDNIKFNKRDSHGARDELSSEVDDLKCNLEIDEDCDSKQDFDMDENARKPANRMLMVSKSKSNETSTIPDQPRTIQVSSESTSSMEKPKGVPIGHGHENMSEGKQGIMLSARKGSKQQENVFSTSPTTSSTAPMTTTTDLSPSDSLKVTNTQALKVEKPGKSKPVSEEGLDDDQDDLDESVLVSKQPTGNMGDEEDDDEGVFRDILNGNLDRYGFATTQNTSASTSMSAMSLARDRQTYWSKTETEYQRRQRVRLENLRTQKWLRMLSKWNEQALKKPKRLQRRIRKGVPDCFRDRVWPLLVTSLVHQQQQVGLALANSKDSFETLLSKANKSVDPEMEKIRECISRDIGRTFPRHIIFHKSGGIGQRALTNVLRAYAALDLEVGYCQGMGFIVGLLLGYVPESQAFSIFRTLMLKKPWQMCELYKPGMPGSQLLLTQYEILLKEFVPEVAAHLEEEMIVPSMYATQWFITVFTYNFPFDVVVRVWDIFLSEGWTVVHQVAIAIMKKNSKEILCRKFEQILEYFKGIPPSLNPQEILDIALSVPITQKTLQKLPQSM